MNTSGCAKKARHYILVAKQQTVFFLITVTIVSDTLAFDVYKGRLRLLNLRSLTRMSGVETVVGLALGVLPLLISAAEHYADCLRPFVRYKNFSREAHRFQNLLDIQKTIFRNQCRILLEKIVEHDVASSILNGSQGANHPSWSDVELEAQLSQLLADSRGACMTIVEMIEERLRDIEAESQDLETIIYQDYPVFHHDPIAFRRHADKETPLG